MYTDTHTHNTHARSHFAHGRWHGNAADAFIKRLNQLSSSIIIEKGQFRKSHDKKNTPYNGNSGRNLELSATIRIEVSYAYTFGQAQATEIVDVHTK